MEERWKILLIASVWFMVSIPVSFIQLSVLKPHILFFFYVFGIILIIVSIRTPQRLKVETRRVYLFKLSYLADRSLKLDYQKDTEEWFQRVFERDLKMLALLIGGLCAVVCAGYFFIVRNVSEFQDMIPILEEIVNSESPYETYLIIDFFISYAALLYFYIRLAIVCFGTSNMMHHFSFWEFEEPLDPSKDPSASLILLNIASFILATACFTPYFIGVVLCGTVFVISPINPDHKYCEAIKTMRKTKKRFHGLFPWTFILLIVVRLIFVDKFSFFSLYLTVADLVMIVFYSILLYRFFRGRNGRNRDYSFDSTTRFERIASWLRVDHSIIMFIFIMLPTAPVTIDVSLFYARYGYVLGEHLELILCVSLFSITFLILFSGLLRIKRLTHIIAEIYYPYTRKDKQLEMKYHFWETFSSPQKIAFSLPYGLIFILWNEDIFMHIEMTRPWLGLSIESRLILDFCFLVMGLGFGSIIWTFYHAPHFSWHSMELVVLSSAEIGENERLLDAKPLNEQFITIILVSVSALVTFGFGYYMFYQSPITTYLSSYSVIAAFFMIMIFGYRLIVTRSLNEKRDNLLESRENN